MISNAWRRGEPTTAFKLKLEGRSYIFFITSIITTPLKFLCLPLYENNAGFQKKIGMNLQMEKPSIETKLKTQAVIT